MIAVKLLSDSLQSNIKEISFDKPLLSGEDIIDLCTNKIALPPFVICYKITRPESFLIATDHIRGIPIFYILVDNVLVVSDLISDLLSYSRLDIDPKASDEFLFTGYTKGNSTLIKEIKQLQAGEYLYVSENGIEIAYYIRFLTKTRWNLPYPVLQQKLNQIFEDVFSSLIEGLNGRTAVISLSGGYDSRLIAYWLHKLSYSKIICFTYGRTDNCEIENADNTAKQLGLPWHFIDYTKLPIQDYLDSEVFLKYYQYMANYSSMFFMQDYFAVQYLKENNILPMDAVFIPGHSGDGLAGSHLSRRLGRKLTTSQVANEIFIYNYSYTNINDRKKKLIIANLANDLPTNYPTSLVFEDWDIRERQAKFIVNSARIYPFFGFSYYLPLWDIRLVNFFKSLPFELKLHKKLYTETLEKLFSESNLIFPNETKPTNYEYKLRDFKQSIITHFPFLKRIKQLPKKDPICYQEITNMMTKNLEESNIPIYKVYTYNGYIVQWYLAKIQSKIK